MIHLYLKKSFKLSVFKFNRIFLCHFGHFAIVFILLFVLVHLFLLLINYIKDFGQVFLELPFFSVSVYFVL